MYTFSVSATPTVTAGAYSAGDIMGGLLTFKIAEATYKLVEIMGVQVAIKAAVTPSLTLVLFNADPASTTQTDNAAYSLSTSDVFKVRGAIPIDSLGGFLVDHGTPNTIHLGNLNLFVDPVAGTCSIYGLLVDNTGVTLTGTSDIQVTLSGRGY